MSQGLAIGNQRGRQQYPRQVGDLRNRIPNPGYVFIAPPEYFDPPEQEPLVISPRREEGSGGLTFVLLLILTALVVVIYWTFIKANSPAAPVNPPASEARRTEAVDLPRVDLTDIRQVDVFELNMRERPSMTSPIKFILPRDTRVEVLNEQLQEPDGDIWVKVRVQTSEGLQDGWVDAQYIR